MVDTCQAIGDIAHIAVGRTEAIIKVRLVKSARVVKPESPVNMLGSLAITGLLEVSFEVLSTGLDHAGYLLLIARVSTISRSLWL